MPMTLSYSHEYTQHAEINLFDFVRIYEKKSEDPPPIHLGIQEFCQFYESLGETQKRIFWVLHYDCVTHKESFASQQNISKRAKCSRQYVNETISLFCKNNILKKTRRYRKSSTYSLHDLLKNDRLKHTISALRSSEKSKIIPIEATIKTTIKQTCGTLPVKATEPEKTRLYNICNIRIRNTNTPIQETKPFGKIKEVFQDFSFPEKDKIAFSRYTDQEIDTAMELYGLELDKGYEMLSKVKVFQWCLNRARKGEQPPPNSAAPPPVHRLLEDLNISELDKKRFSQYAESAIIEALYRFDWYNKKQRIQKPGAYLQAVFNDKNKRVVPGHQEQADRGKIK